MKYSAVKVHEQRQRDEGHRRTAKVGDEDYCAFQMRRREGKKREERRGGAGDSVMPCAVEDRPLDCTGHVTVKQGQ